MSIVVKNLQNNFPVNSRVSRLIKNAVQKTLKSGKGRDPGEVTVCLVDNRAIRKLNRQYLKRDRATDVIAFTVNRQPLVADIAVSVPVAVSNAEIFRTRATYELLLYAVHGTLHALGFDDKTARQRAAMQRKAERILASLKIFKNAHP